MLDPGRATEYEAQEVRTDYQISPSFLPFQESNRSKHYVAMDFSGKVGRICSEKDIKGFTSKDGYAYFRRKVRMRSLSSYSLFWGAGIDESISCAFVLEAL